MAMVEPLSRGHKKRERTRRLLIAAAVDTIAERGEAFGISHVTERAGVSNGTFYNYFDDRDGLIEALVPEVMSVFAAESADAVDADDADDPALRFATITVLTLRRAAAAPDRLRAVLRLDAVQRAILDGAAIEHLMADLATGAAAGRFSAEPDEMTLDVVVGALLLAARRLVDRPVPDGYLAGVTARLLVALGLDADEATELGAAAVARVEALLID